MSDAQASMMTLIIGGSLYSIALTVAWFGLDRTRRAIRDGLVRALRLAARRP